MIKIYLEKSRSGKISQNKTSSLFGSVLKIKRQYKEEAQIKLKFKFNFMFIFFSVNKPNPKQARKQDKTMQVSRWPQPARRNINRLGN